MFIVLNAYCFFNIKEDNLESIKDEIMSFMFKYKAYGLSIVSREGCNIGMCCPKEYETRLQSLVQRILPKDAIINLTSNSYATYKRKIVKIKSEIVKMCLDCNSINPGQLLSPEEWHKAIQNPNGMVIDARNYYEYKIGRFKNSIHMNIPVFSEFKKQWKEQYSDLSKDTKILMACTGGIRCEKTTHYLKQHGYKYVYHLKGGMLAYLQQYKNKADSLWEGDLYVFDNRQVINSQLDVARYTTCWACGQPVSEEDQQNKNYVKYVSCPGCIKGVE